MPNDTVKVPRVGYGLTDILKIPGNRRNKVSTPLDQWMTKNNLSKHDLAIALGCNHEAVNQWRFGQVVPGLVQAFLLERLSKGAIPVSSWLAVPPALAKFQMFEAKRKSRQAGHYNANIKTGGIL